MKAELAQFTLDTSFEEFMTLPSTVNPRPDLIGENGIQVADRGGFVAVHYVDAKVGYTGKAPIAWPQRPRKNGDGEAPEVLACRDAFYSHEWQSPESYWDDVAPEIVRTTLRREVMSDVESQAVRAALPYSVYLPPTNGADAMHAGARIVNYEAAFHEVLGIARQAAVQGDWRTAGAVQEILSLNCDRTDGEDSVFFGSFHDYYHLHSDLSVAITGLSNDTIGELREQEEEFRHSYSDMPGSVGSNVMRSFPFVDALAHTISQEPDSEASKKLEILRQGLVRSIASRVTDSEVCVNAFLGTRALPRLNLLDKVMTYSGMEAPDLTLDDIERQN